MIIALLAGGAAMLSCSTSTGGSTVTCTSNECTATFDRNANDTVTILGVDVKLVGTDASNVTLLVGETQIVLPAQGGSKTAGGLKLTVKEVTDTQVILTISKA